MARKKTNQFSPEDADPILGPVSPDAINEELAVIRFVEKETRAEKVKFFEKVKTEQVFDTQMVIWSVHTDKDQYWVITNPAGLYSISLFPSFDYAITFHVGLFYRSASNHHTEEVEKEQDQLAVPWRRWEHAAAALAQSTAAEEFQAVGILCRECLLSLVKTIVSDEMVPLGTDRPKLADFLSWSELISNSIGRGSNAGEVRSYLITISKAAWQLVNWLAQAANAGRVDGNMAVEAVEYVLLAFGAALLRQANEISDP
jgi:hypothetical protein